MRCGYGNGGARCPAIYSKDTDWDCRTEQSIGTNLYLDGRYQLARWDSQYSKLLAAILSARDSQVRDEWTAGGQPSQVCGLAGACFRRALSSEDTFFFIVYRVGDTVIR